MKVFDGKNLEHVGVLKQYIASKTGFVDPPAWDFSVSQETAIEMCACLWIREHPLERALAECVAGSGHHYRLISSRKITRLEEMRCAYEGLSRQYAEEYCWQHSSERRYEELLVHTDELEATMLRMHELLQEASRLMPGSQELKQRIDSLLQG